MNMNFDNPFALATRPAIPGIPGMNTDISDCWGISSSPRSTKGYNVALIERGSQVMAHEKCRAVLAYGAIQELAALSAVAVQEYRNNPFSEEDYRKVVGAFAIGASMNIMRF